MTMYGSPFFSLPTSSTRAVCGLWSRTAARASRAKRSALPGIGERLLQHELQRDALTELGVSRGDDDPHPAGTEHTLDAVLAAEQVTRFDLGGGHYRRRAYQLSRQANACPRGSAGLSDAPHEGHCRRRGARRLRGRVPARGARDRRRARRAEATRAHTGAEHATASASSSAPTRCAARRSSTPSASSRRSCAACGSLVMEVAEIAKVPAGGALAVDRDVFAQGGDRAHRRASAHHRERTRSSGRSRRRRPSDRSSSRPARSRATTSRRTSPRPSGRSTSRTTTPSRRSSAPTRSTGRRSSASRAGARARPWTRARRPTEVGQARRA